MKKNIALQHVIIISAFLGSFSASADDFTEMLFEVNQNHPALQAEREQLQSIEQGVYQAYSGFLPSANVEYARGRQRIKYNSLTPDFQNSDNKQLVLSQPIFNGGGSIAQIGGAKARLAGEEFRLKQLQQQVLLSAVTAYIDVVEKQEVFSISKKNIEALTKHLVATKRQFDAGELTVTDVSQSEARLARAQAELHDAQAALSDSHDAYVRETGKEPTATAFPLLPTGVPESTEVIISEGEFHPAILEAKKNEEVADYTVDERTAALLPSMRVEGQLGTRKGSSQPAVNYTNDRSVMLRVSVPIFQSGAEYSRIIEARHQYERSKNQTEDITRDTLKTALREWNNYKAAGDAIIEHRNAVEAGQRAFESVSKEQLAGSRTVLDVLNAQDELQAAEVNLIRAQSRQILSAYRLLAATGKLDRVIGTHTVEEDNQVNLPL